MTEEAGRQKKNAQDDRGSKETKGQPKCHSEQSEESGSLSVILNAVKNLVDDKRDPSTTLRSAQDDKGGW